MHNIITQSCCYISLRLAPIRDALLIYCADMHQILLIVNGNALEPSEFDMDLMDSYNYSIPDKHVTPAPSLWSQTGSGSAWEQKQNECSMSGDICIEPSKFCFFYID